MYKKMLVPLDGSELAEIVFTYAKELAGRLDLELFLLHVHDPSEDAALRVPDAYLNGARDSMMVQVAELRTGLGLKDDKSLKVEYAAIPGHPAEEILRYAEGNDIDLILIATHGRSGIKRWVLGSVADKVLRASKVPVWIARAVIPQEIVHDEWPTRKLLVPLDGSEVAETILPHTEALTKQRGAELVEVTLIRVCESPFITADYPEATTRLTWKEHVEIVQAKFKKGCEEYLAGVEKRLRDAGITVRSEVLMGNPADEIVSYAKRNHFNLIAMCTHARSQPGRLAYGSVADKVVRGASSPVFLVRPS
jgi:nucleotide-binding universal stress UspA family protein